MVMVPTIRMIDTVNWNTTRKFLRRPIHPDPPGIFPFKTRVGENCELYMAERNPVNSVPDTSRIKKRSMRVKISICSGLCIACLKKGSKRKTLVKLMISATRFKDADSVKNWRIRSFFNAPDTFRIPTSEALPLNVK